MPDSFLWVYALLPVGLRPLIGVHRLGATPPPVQRVGEAVLVRSPGSWRRSQRPSSSASAPGNARRRALSASLRPASGPPLATGGATRQNANGVGQRFQARGRQVAQGSQSHVGGLYLSPHETTPPDRRTPVHPGRWLFSVFAAAWDGPSGRFREAAPSRNRLGRCHAPQRPPARTRPGGFSLPVGPARRGVARRR